MEQVPESTPVKEQAPAETPKVTETDQTQSPAPTHLPGVEPVKVKTALINAHTVLTAAFEAAVRNTEVAALEGADVLSESLDNAKNWLVEEIRKYDPATADELAKK